MTLWQWWCGFRLFGLLEGHSPMRSSKNFRFTYRCYCGHEMKGWKL
jgi:hypothetical protein